MTTDSGEQIPSNPSSSNVPDSLLVLHNSQLVPIEKEIEERKAELKKATDKLKLQRKLMASDGIDLKVFDETRAEWLTDADEVRQRYAIKASYHRAFKSPYADQLDLFEQPDRTELEETWRFQGWRAGANGVGTEHCPHLASDAGHKFWMAGWNAAQQAIVAGMAIREDEQPAADPDDVDEPDVELGEDESDGEEDWRSERDAELEAGDPASDEESALKGIEA